MRTYRAVTGREEQRHHNERHENRFARWHWDDDGSLVISARLSPEDGAVVLAALEAGREALEAQAEVVDAEEEAAGTSSEASNRDPDSAASSPSARARPSPTSDSTASFVPAGRASSSTGDSAASSAPGGAGSSVSDDAAASLLAETRRADALVAAARLALSAPAGANPPPAEIVIVDRAVLSGERDEGCCHLDGQVAIPPETARRLACDATLVALVEAADGTPLDVGRKRRTPPAALRRALRRRDCGCRFPGCGRRRFLHAHHIVHWIKGGETKLTNETLLCSAHHRLAHEGGYRIETPADHVFVFFDPAGRMVPEVAPTRPAMGPGLTERNRAAGLTITPETGRSLGGGEPYDLGLTIDVLVSATERAAGTAAAAAAQRRGWTSPRPGGGITPPLRSERASQTARIAHVCICRCFRCMPDASADVAGI